MVKVIEQSREITPQERYFMTISPKLTMIKDVEDGTIIPVDVWIVFQDINEETGETSELVGILSGNKGYVAQSQTFKRSLKDIQDCMGSEPFKIEKLSGKTKAGRPYVNCALALD